MKRRDNGNYKITYLDGSVRVLDTLVKADLRSANLRCADLHDADLSGANLHGANLHDEHEEALHRAADRGQEQIVEYLLKEGADFEALTNNQQERYKKYKPAIGRLTKRANH